MKGPHNLVFKWTRGREEKEKADARDRPGFCRAAQRTMQVLVFGRDQMRSTKHPGLHISPKDISSMERHKIPGRTGSESE